MRGGGKAAALQPPAERRRGRGLFAAPPHPGPWQAPAASLRPRPAPRRGRRRGPRWRGGTGERPRGGARGRVAAGGGGLSLPLPPRRRGSPFRLPEARRGAGRGGGRLRGRREEPISRSGRGPALLGWERAKPGRSVCRRPKLLPCLLWAALTAGGILLFNVGETGHAREGFSTISRRES